MASQLSVIIPTYYRHSELKGILGCLEGQTMPPDEVIVVDQTPQEDRPPEFYRRYEESLPLRLVNLSRPSSTASRNVGARLARGEVLLFLDDKVMGQADLMESHLRVMDREHVDVVHGAIIINRDELPDRPPWHQQIRRLDPALIFMISANCRWQGMTIGLSTANMSIKRDVYWRAGGMDEVMSGRWDDVEFGYRLFRAGAKMFFSSEAAIRNKRLHWGGGHHEQPGFWGRVFRPHPHPNYLYFHMKHLPGWSTRQLILKTLFDVYCPSSYWIRHPWNLVLLPIKVARAVYISRTMLRQCGEGRGQPGESAVDEA